MNKRVVVSMAVGLLATALVYLGLENSLREHSFNRFPISSERAISILIKQLNITGANPNDLSTHFVYIKGDGTVYASDVNLNAIGKYLYTSEPTVTTGSHFAWKVENRKDNSTFFVDSVTGEVVSQVRKRR